MNIAKNMEVIFVAATLVLSVTSAAIARPAPRQTPVLEQPEFKATVTETATGKMSTVIVSAKRLSAAQKAAIAA